MAGVGGPGVDPFFFDFHSPKGCLMRTRHAGHVQIGEAMTLATGTEWGDPLPILKREANST